jgi:hypothetical protein
VKNLFKHETDQANVLLTRSLGKKDVAICNFAQYCFNFNGILRASEKFTILKACCEKQVDFR